MSITEILLVVLTVINIICATGIILLFAYGSNFLAHELHILKTDHFDINVMMCKLIDKINEKHECNRNKATI